MSVVLMKGICQQDVHAKLLTQPHAAGHGMRQKIVTMPLSLAD